MPIQRSNSKSQSIRASKSQVRIAKPTRILGMILASLFANAAITNLATAQDPHPYLSGSWLDPAKTRPNFFPRTIINSIPEYRQVYNRPRYVPGWIAHVIEPSSQEAMAWETNYCNGNYQNHRGPCIPMYMYAKPWESLNTCGRGGSRDDTSFPAGVASTLGSAEEHVRGNRTVPQQNWQEAEPYRTEPRNVNPREQVPADRSNLLPVQEISGKKSAKKTLEGTEVAPPAPLRKK